MCAPMRAALGSALWLEGVAGTPAEALELVEDGQIPLATNHDAGGVGPMAGVVNPSMPVWVARDEATGKVAWCPLNEGSGAVLRYGADGPEVLERLRWMRDVLAPELAPALDAPARSTCYELHVRSLALGDEAHHRTEEGTALTLEALGIEHPEVARSSPATASSSSTSRWSSPSSPWTAPRTFRARRSSPRSPATASRSASASPAPATSGSSARPRCPTRRSCSTATRRPT